MDTHTRHTLADLARRHEVMLTFGTIAAVDTDRQRLRVDIGDPDGGPDACRRTGWLPAPGHIGRNYRAAHPLRKGTQVLLACPSGDPANGRVVEVFYTNDLPAPSADPDIDTIVFDDGTTLTYDSASHTLTADCIGDITATAAGNLTARAGGNATVAAGADLSATSGGDTLISAAGKLTAKSSGPANVQSDAFVGISAPAFAISGFCTGGGNEITFLKPVRFRENVNFDKSAHAGGNLTCDGSNSNHHTHASESS
jgi:phage baseplate assembly protein V